jgi:hypothetical protein
VTALPPIPERVSACIALLDQHAVPEWPWLIDLARLNLASPTDCIFGQLFSVQALLAKAPSGWTFGIRKFDLYFDDTVALGLNVDDGGWRELDEEWRVALIRLRSERIQAWHERRADELINEIEDLAALDVPESDRDNELERANEERRAS